MWVPGFYIGDMIMCHVWHSQVIFWMFTVASVWNLVALTYERYLCVCHPFKHQLLTKKKVYIIIVCTYFLNLGYVPTAIMLTVHLVDGVCISEYVNDTQALSDYADAYLILWFTLVYALPCIFFAICYSLVIYQFKKRKSKSDELGASRVIDKAQSELTKTGIVVTLIFWFSLSFDTWYYVLGYYNSSDNTYGYNSPTQKIGLWLVSFNSFANPIVYGLLVPAYRKSLQTMFCGWYGKK